MFLFGRACAVCPSSGLEVVSVGCYIYIAGRKPVSCKGNKYRKSGILHVVRVENPRGHFDLPEHLDKEDDTTPNKYGWKRLVASSRLGVSETKNP